MSEECKDALIYTAEEAERLGHKHIEPVHLLFGLLKEEKCSAARTLREHGLTLAQVSEEIQNMSPPRPES